MADCNDFGDLSHANSGIMTDLNMLTLNIPIVWAEGISGTSRANFKSLRFFDASTNLQIKAYNFIWWTAGVNLINLLGSRRYSTPKFTPKSFYKSDSNQSEWLKKPCGNFEPLCLVDFGVRIATTLKIVYEIGSRECFYLPLSLTNILIRNGVPNGQSHNSVIYNCAAAAVVGETSRMRSFLILANKFQTRSIDKKTFFCPLSSFLLFRKKWKQNKNGFLASKWKLLSGLVGSCREFWGWASATGGCQGRRREHSRSTDDARNAK